MKKIYLLTVILLVGFSACKLDPNWDVDALAPIAETTLTPANLLGDSNLVVEPSGSLIFDYTGKVFDFPVDSLLSIPDSTYSYSFNSPVSFTIQPGFPIQVFNDYIKFNLPDIGLRTAVIESGRLRIEVLSTCTQPAVLNFQIPKSTKNGIAFSFTDNLEAAPQGGYSSYIKEFDISGYDIDFSGDDFDEFNILRLQISATISPTADAFPVTAGQELIKTNLSFTGLKPSYATGKIETRSIQISSDTVSLPFMDLIKSGVVDVDAVDLNLAIKNGFGVDASCKIDYLTGMNQTTNNIVSLNHPIIGNAINLNAATNTASGNLPFTYSTYNLDITTANSNLEAFAVNFPHKIALNGQFVINPNGNLSAGHDFVYSKSSAQVVLHAVAPLQFSADNLVLADSVPFNGSSLVKNNPVKSGTLKVYAENKFPFEFGIKLSAYDSLGTMVWSQLNEEVLQAGIIEPDGRVYQPVSSTMTFQLSEQDIEQLSHGKSFYFEVRFATKPTAQLIKIYQDYFLGLKVIANIKAQI